MEKAINFKSSDNTERAGIFSGDFENITAPVFILCHGHGSHKNSKTFVSLKEKLDGDGISTFRFDFFGHGESEGKLEDINCTRAIDDVLCAIRFLQKDGYRKIGLVGSSFGGFAAIIAASKTPEIFALALKSPALDYSAWKKRMIRDFGENWERDRHVVFTTSSVRCILDSERLDAFVKDALKYNPFEAAKRVTAPAFVVHGGNDEIAPLELSQKFSEIMPNCELSAVDGADHEYTINNTFDKMIGALAEFIIRISKK